MCGPFECWQDGSRRGEGVIKKAWFSEEKMVKIFREAYKSPVAEKAKRHGVSDQKGYR